jgi:hypothetical protein
MPTNDPRRRAQGRTYYERLARQYGMQSDWVKRYVMAQYGDDPSGTAVYKDSFRINFHVADEITPIPGVPIIIGQDFGRDPCSVLMQFDHKGRILVLEELIAEDTGLELHIQSRLRPTMMQQRYLGLQYFVVGDPAGIAKDTLYEETSYDLLKRNGFPAFPAPTNDIDPRLRAVDAYLLAQRDGGPAIVFDRQRCPVLIRAMSGGYRFGKTRLGQRKPLPDKNAYSHISDALQYGCLSAQGGMVTMAVRNITRRPSMIHQAPPASSWT